MGLRRMPIIAVLALAVLSVGSYGAHLATRRPYLTVSEVWRGRDRLKGQVITVRGYFGHFGATLTAQKCVPRTCDCNLSSATRIWLYDEPGGEVSPRFPGEGVPPKAMAMDILQCSGNECVIGCNPIDPQTQDEVEFRGKLAIAQEDTVFPYLVLESVWWWEARQQVGGVWQPMPIGSFVIRLPQRE